ncbi:hypothetical protein ABZ590_39110, partial [Streptomyces hirsutus]
LAAHPDVVQAANVRDRTAVLFYEDVNYAASGAPPTAAAAPAPYGGPAAPRNSLDNPPAADER